jgi:hypothetical protein
MNNTTINITKYDPAHTDFENSEYFPTTDLLTYNQMIDVLADPFTTLAVCVLTGQMYLSTYGTGELKPIQEINLKDLEFSEDVCVLEALEEASLITYFRIHGEHFGTSMMAWDIFREGVDDKRSKQAEILAKETGIFETNTHTRIEFTPEMIIPHSLKIYKIEK